MKLPAASAFFYTIFCFAFFLNCSQNKVLTNAEVKKIYINRVFPIVELTGEMHIEKDSTCIYFYKDYLLYQMPVRYFLEDEVKVLIDEVRYKYFLYKANNQYGKIFDSLNVEISKNVKADSILVGLNNYGFDKAPILNYFIKELKDSIKNEVVDIYVPKQIKTDGIEDTAYFYYTKDLNRIKYSFAPELDSAKGMKLYKIRLLFNSRFSEQHKIMAPKREILYEFGEIKLENRKQVIDFIEKNKDK